MKNLKQLRQANKMTQQEVADILNIQRPTYSRYESGEREPDNKTIIKLCELFNCSLDYLFGLVNDPKQNLMDTHLEGADFSLWNEMKNLSEEQKQDVLDYIRFKKKQKGE